ncbi:MAG: hypothetical protein ACPGLV_19655, partial [Bacteroidia bacterium]
MFCYIENTVDKSISIFKCLPNDIKFLFLLFVDSETKQNLFIHYNEDFYNCYYNHILFIASQILLVDTNNLWNVTKDNLYFYDIDIKCKQMIYICQLPKFENLLLEAQSLVFKK